MPAIPSDRPAGPLTGLVIADFSRILAGPYATMVLGDLGATVIKVESTAGDDTRHWVPPRYRDVGTYYLAINRNKRSIVLDFDEPADLAAAQALSARADVLIQNFMPGSLGRFGLDYAAVSGRNPRAIYCSISGFGTGAGAELPGYDMLVQAVSGLMSMTGSPDGPAYRTGISLFDIITGLHAVTGILAALHHRDDSGEGQHVEVNLLSSALSAMANQASAYVAGNVVPHRMGNSHLSLFPYEPLRTADGELVVIAANDGQFRRLADALGASELSADARFASMESRNVNRQQLRPLLEDLLAGRTTAAWTADLSAAGVPCGPVNTIAEGIELATGLGLEPVVTAGTGDVGVPTIGNPIRMSTTPVGYELAPPALDADGDAVRAWLAAGPGSVL